MPDIPADILAQLNEQSAALNTLQAKLEALENPIASEPERPAIDPNSSIRRCPYMGGKLCMGQECVHWSYLELENVHSKQTNGEWGCSINQHYTATKILGNAINRLSSSTQSLRNETVQQLANITATINKLREDNRQLLSARVMPNGTSDHFLEYMEYK